MKKTPLILLLVTATVLAVASCSSDNDNDWESTYAEWRQKNEVWLAEQQARVNADGTPYYQSVVPAWDPSTFVLIHYFNDRELTKDNLSPLSTSTVDTRYIVHYCNDVPLDSSYTLTANGPGVFRTQLNRVIQGWTIAMETMHVGDTAEIVIPYQAAYGVSLTSSVPPYSNLRFNVRLVDIPYYETNPK